VKYLNIKQVRVALQIKFQLIRRSALITVDKILLKTKNPNRVSVKNLVEDVFLRCYQEMEFAFSVECFQVSSLYTKENAL